MLYSLFSCRYSLPSGRAGIGIALFFLLFLVSCGPQRGRVRIRGEFENLPQADLLLYSPDGGMSVIDTLHILRGKFDYQTRVEGTETYTFVIVYPNFSTLGFQAHSGSDVRIKGDALSLNKVIVEGADSVIPSEIKKAKNPLSIGKKLPQSEIIKHRKGTYLLIAFFADWKNGGSYVNHLLRTSLNENHNLHAFSYSLNLQPSKVRDEEPVDSTRWHTYCDYNGWGGPLLSRLGIRNIPYFILVGPEGRILALGPDFYQDIKSELQKIP